MTDGKLSIAIIAGGLTHERDVSIRSGRRTAAALKSRGHEVFVLDIDQRLIPTLDYLNPDVVWPMVHGSNGEDGTLQDLLDLVGVNYVGSSASAARRASAKPVAKAVARAAGVHTPRSVTLAQSLFRQIGAQAILTAVSSRFELPVVVKPAEGGSALGVSIVRTDEELRTAMVDAFAYDEQVLVEAFVAGQEVTVSIVEFDDEIRALPVVEISTDSGPYDYDARYNTGRSQFFVPARLDKELTAQVQQAAVRVHKALGLCDLSRIDLIVTEHGTPWFIDANVTPGMTDTSLFPQAAEAIGDYPELLERIAQHAAHSPGL